MSKNVQVEPSSRLTAAGVHLIMEDVEKQAATAEEVGGTMAAADAKAQRMIIQTWLMGYNELHRA